MPASCRAEGLGGSQLQCGIYWPTLLLIWCSHTGDEAAVSNTPHHLALLHSLCFSPGDLFSHLHILVLRSLFVFWVAHICGSQACALWLHLPKGQSFWSYLLAFAKPQNNTLSLSIRWLVLLLSFRHRVLYTCCYCVNSFFFSSQCSFHFGHNWDRYLPYLVKSKGSFSLSSLQEWFLWGNFSLQNAT